MMAARKATPFELPAGEQGEVIFLGDSITEGGMWKKLFPDAGATNRGIGGDATSHILPNRREGPGGAILSFSPALWIR